MKTQPWQIKMIHTLKGALQLDDDTYRGILSGYKVKSSKELTAFTAGKLIEDLTAKATASGVWKVGAIHESPGQRRKAEDDMSRMIRGLWIELHEAGKVRDPSEKALGAYVFRMSRKSALQWCSTADKTVIIEALKKWLAREGK